MTTIIYKNLVNRYIIDSCFEAVGDGVAIEFCEPIDAKLIVGSEIFRVENGVCRITAVPEGEILPKLYTGTGMHELESFVYRNGVATPNRDKTEMIAELFRAVDSILERLTEAEKEILELNEKVSRRISILGYGDTEKTKNQN